MTEISKPKSFLERVRASEVLICIAGVFLLCSGFYTGDPMQYFFGGMIICGSVALHFVRRKDWKKHWEEQEEIKKRMDAAREREREMKNAGGK